MLSLNIAKKESRPERLRR